MAEWSGVPSDLSLYVWIGVNNVAPASSSLSNATLEPEAAILILDYERLQDMYS